MPLGNRTDRTRSDRRRRRRTLAGLAMAVVAVSALTLSGSAVADLSPGEAAAPSAAASPAVCAASAAAAVNNAGSSDGLLVHFDAKASAGAVEKAVAAAGGAVQDDAGATGFVRVSTRTKPAASVAAALAASPVVQTVEPNPIRDADMVPNDPNYSRDPGYLEALHLPEAWDRTTGSDNQILAIIDSGVDLSHPDLAGRLVQGYDFVNNDSDPSDDFGHGTMVAGIAA